MGSSRGHAILINMSSYAPFIFTYNTERVKSDKKINYAIAPNVGGAFKKRYFSGFDTEELKFDIIVVDMEGPTGVKEEIAFFEQLREPDPGPLGGWGLSYGNVNYPPPQVLFQFGKSYIPLVWDVIDVSIDAGHFRDGLLSGMIGVPKEAKISITLALDEGHVLNQANMIAKKAEMYAASAESIIREVLHKTKGTRKEAPGLFSKQAKANESFMKRNKVW